MGSSLLKVHAAPPLVRKKKPTEKEEHTMWKIILLAVLLGIAAYLFIAKPKLTRVEEIDDPERGYPYKVKQTRNITLHRFGWIPLGLALLLLLGTSFTQVHAKEVGVGVAWGKPVAEYDAGLHFKPFWYSVTKINGTVYTDTYSGKDALPVRLADGNPATASVTLRWHVNPEAVDYIYATYRSDNPSEQLRDAVVDTQLKAVVNNVFSTFNPTATVQQVNAENPEKAAASLNFSPNYSQMAEDIDQQMLNAVKDASGLPLVVIDKVTVSGVSYSSATEARISSIMQQVAQTQKNVQLEASNQALSDAIAKLKDTLHGPDGQLALVQQCLNDLADGKFTPPAGFSCWPGSGGSVVVPSSR